MVRSLGMSATALLGIAALALAATLALPTAQAEASFPGRNGLIAYADGGIRVMNPDGTGMRRLTYNAADRQPAWSPDGRKIAFSRNGDIWVMNAAGSEKERVTTHAGTETDPAWSPDGTRLAFSSDRTSTPGAPSSIGSEIWQVNYPKPYGNAIRVVAAATHPDYTLFGRPPAFLSVHDARWSPDGSRIAVAVSLSDFGENWTNVYTVGPGGTDWQYATFGLFGEWSPDNTQIASLDVDFFDACAPSTLSATRIAADGSPLGTTVLNPSEDGAVWGAGGHSGPAWSPDGEHLAIYLELYNIDDPATGSECWAAEDPIGTGLYRFRADGLGTGQYVAAVPETADPDWQPVPQSRPECTITGTPHDDVLNGTWRDDIICGLGGNDVIRGRGGKDTVHGGDGNDTIYGNAGSDHLLGEAGNDQVYGGDGFDTVNGGKGRDRMYGNRGDDTLWAKDFWKDVVSGGPGSDDAHIDRAKDTTTSIESLF